MTTNLRAKKVLCHHAEVLRISGVPTIDRVFCNVCDWRLENSPQKAISINEAWGISWTSPDPLLSGRVWARDYNCTRSNGKLGRSQAPPLWNEARVGPGIVTSHVSSNYSLVPILNGLGMRLNIIVEVTWLNRLTLISLLASFPGLPHLRSQ